MNSTKRGRKPKPHVTSWNETINGLRRRPVDGKWQLADGRVFSEPNEAKAVERFRQMTDQLNGAQRRMMERPNPFSLPLDDMIRIVCDEIRKRPEYVAKIGGIEQLAYLDKLTKPKPLPTPSELRALYKKHATGSTEDRDKVLRYWDYFVEETELKSLDQITDELAVAFRDTLWESEWSGKTQAHVIGSIRRVFNLTISRAIAVPQITELLANIGPKLLFPSESTVTRNPKPIEVDDFHKMLNAAEGQEKAFLLLMLNAALYVKEVIALKWDDFYRGCLRTRREKTGKCVRAAVLWPETVKALEELPRLRDELFVTYQGLPYERCGAHRMFSRIATRAKVAVTGSMLRDGAYTEAVGGNIQPDLVNTFVGHASGLMQSYVLANPRIVKPCTDAVYRIYFGQKEQAKAG